MDGPLALIRDLREQPARRVAIRGRLTRPYWRRRFRDFGPGSVLHRPDWVYGPRQISIGARLFALHGLWLSAERVTWDLPGPAITIGDGVGIRPYCTITASESIVIEDNVTIAAFSSIIDSDHVHTGQGNIVWSGGVATTPVRIGEGTWIGERVTVLRGSDIGKYCTIGANSVVRGHIPDYSVAVGVPARVVGTTMSPDGAE